MGQKDLHSITKKTLALPIQKIGTDTTTVGVGIDTTFFRSAEFVVVAGDVVVSLFKAALVIQDSDTDSNYIDVDQEFILGDIALAFVDENNEFSTDISLGYIGGKRFVRATLVSTGAGAGEGIDEIAVILVADSPAHVPFIPSP